MGLSDFIVIYLSFSIVPHSGIFSGDYCAYSTMRKIRMNTLIHELTKQARIVIIDASFCNVKQNFVLRNALPFFTPFIGGALTTKLLEAVVLYVKPSTSLMRRDQQCMSLIDCGDFSQD
jgi:hypothetical protein